MDFNGPRDQDCAPIECRIASLSCELRAGGSIAKHKNWGLEPDDLYKKARFWELKVSQLVDAGREVEGRS